MTQDHPPLTHADTRLIDDLAAQIGVVERLPQQAEGDAEAVERELGWMRALQHLARRHGLSHAGKVEAAKIVAASREWVAEFLGEEPEGRGRE